jgi:hypothetical protein
MKSFKCRVNIDTTLQVGYCKISVDRLGETCVLFRCLGPTDYCPQTTRGGFILGLIVLHTSPLSQTGVRVGGRKCKERSHTAYSLVNPRADAHVMTGSTTQTEGKRRQKNSVSLTLIRISRQSIIGGKNNTPNPRVGRYG